MKRGNYIRTKEIREKISKKLKGRKIIFNKNSGFQKGNIPYNKGKKMSKKYCKKLSKVRQGHPYYGGGWKGGETHSKETKLKMSNVRKELYKNGIIEGMKKEKNPAWKGGKSFEPYGFEFDEKLKKVIRQRDKFVCQICRKNGFCVHHIDYNKKNNNPNNLITLCRICHGYTNYDREKWRNFFNGIKQKI